MRIRIGNQTSINSGSVMQPFEYAVANGFDAFEWFPDKKESGQGWNEDDLSKEARAAIKETARKKDIALSVHASLPADPLGSHADRLFPKSLELARDIGAALFNIHFHPGRDINVYVKSILPLIKILSQTGIRLSIENTIETKPGDLNRLFRHLRAIPLPSASVGICLDIGHANLCRDTRNDYLKYVDLLDPEVPIIHVHMHENYGDFDSHLTVFTGPSANDPAGIKGLLERLNDRGFSGNIIFEQWPRPADLLVSARDRLTGIIGDPDHPGKSFDASSLDEQLGFLAEKEDEGETGLVHDFLEAREKTESREKVFGALSLLTRLRNSLSTKLSEATGPESHRLRLTDTRLEEFASVLLSRLADYFESMEEMEWGPALHTLFFAVENLRLSGFDQEECSALKAELTAWAWYFEEDDLDHLLRAKATIERCRRLAEGVIRNHPVGQFLKLVTILLKKIRSLAGLDASSETVDPGIFRGYKEGETEKKISEAAVECSEVSISTGRPKLLSLDQVTPETGGNKACGAGRLQKIALGEESGFRTPAAVVLPFGVMEAMLRAAPSIEKEYRGLVSGLDALEGDRLCRALEKLKALFNRLKLSDDVTASIRRIFMDSERLMVRSSPNCRSIYGFPGARVYESITNVAPSEIADALRTVWASLWNLNAVMERKNARISHDRAHMAILVQQMVVPDYSFIMHTANPLSNNPSEILIECAPGLGETLTSGDVTGSPYRIVFDKQTENVSMLAFCSFSSQSLPGDKGGIMRKTVNYASVSMSRDSKVRDIIGILVGRAGRFVESEIGEPQEIEGLTVGDSVYLVQTRTQRQTLLS